MIIYFVCVCVCVPVQLGPHTHLISFLACSASFLIEFCPMAFCLQSIFLSQMVALELIETGNKTESKLHSRLVNCQIHVVFLFCHIRVVFVARLINSSIHIRLVIFCVVISGLCFTGQTARLLQ